MDLRGIFRTFHHKTTEYIFFSSAHGNILQNRSHVSSQNSPQQIQKKKSEVIPYTFSDHNVMELEINQKKKSRKATNN